MAPCALEQETRVANWTQPQTMSEDAIQAGIVDYLRLVLQPGAYVVFSVPNGAKRSMAEAGAKRRTGMLAGVWDICILGPGGATWWLETKTDKGRLSEPQKVMRSFMEEGGVPHAVVRGIDDAQAAIGRWRLRTRLARAA